MRPIERMHKLGLLGPNLIAVHMIHVTADEIELMAAVWAAPLPTAHPRI